MKKFGLPHYSVNTSNLGLYISDCVFYHKGLGPDMDLTISYNSLANASGIFGKKWIFSYESLVVHNGNMLKVISPSGKVTTFHRLQTDRGALVWQAPEGCFDRLEEHEEHWLYFSQGSRLRYYYQKNAGRVESQLTTIADPNGNAVHIEYRTDGKIHKLIDAVGREIEFAYHDEGWCRSFSLEDGRTANFEYDSIGNLVKTTDFARVSTLYAYDREGYLLKMCVGRKKRTTHFYYLNRGNFRTVESIADAMGNKTTYELISLDPRVVRVTHPEGNTTLYQNRNGLTEKVTDSLGFFTATKYQDGKPIRYRDKRGFITSYDYDDRGNQVEVCYPGNRRFQYEYNLDDRLVKITNPLSQTQRFEYDDYGNLVKTISPTGKELVYQYNEKGQPTEIQGLNGIKLIFDHDSFGNVVRVSDADGLSYNSTYDALGYRLMASTDENGHTYRYDYDANNRVTFRTNPDGSHTKDVYDCCSGIQAVDELGNSVTYERDLLNNITQLIDGIGAKTEFFYNANGWLSQIVDPLGNVVSIVKNANGQTISSEIGSGVTVGFDYDEEGNLLAYQDQLGKQTLYEYNDNDEVIQITDFMGEATQFTRDALGRVVEVINARGDRIGFRFDAESRIIEKSYDQAVIATRTFDEVNNQVINKDPHGTVHVQLNKVFQPLKIVYPNRSYASFSYNKVANIEKISYGDQLSIEYGYDARDRITSIKWQDHYINLAYDKANNLLTETRSNGTLTDYEADANSKILVLNHSKGDEVFAGIKLERDLMGRVTRADIVSSLTPPENIPDFQRSIRMNYETKSLLVDGERYKFDRDGNLIEGKDWTAVFDCENRPVEIRLNGWQKHYTYDSNGFRVSEKRGGTQIDFQYDLFGNLLFESNAVGEILKSYIYGGNRLFAVVDSQGDTLFYHYDDMGNTIALTDADGKLVAAYDYEPYGQIRAKSGQLEGNRFTFGGSYGVMDEGQGLYAFKRRFYHSGLGMFIQKDPVGLAGGGNNYAYADGNPKLYVDPQGTSSIVFFLLACASAAGLGYGVGATAGSATRTRKRIEHERKIQLLYEDMLRRPGYWENKIGTEKWVEFTTNSRNRSAFYNRMVLGLKGSREITTTAGETVVDAVLPPKVSISKTLAERIYERIWGSQDKDKCDPPRTRTR